MIHAAALVMSLAASPLSISNAPTLPNADVWDFKVYLDDRDVGQHRFELTREDDAWRLTSEAEFQVKILFFSAYRYQHRSEERWNGSCLAQVNAETNDDGEKFAVRGQDSSDGPFVLADATPLADCVMTFAYWNPQFLEQQQLLNVQTGDYLPVDITPLKGAGLSFEGAPNMRGYRIEAQVSGEEEDMLIDVWYDASGDWVALDALVEGDRVLRYRRQDQPVLVQQASL